MTVDDVLAEGDCLAWRWTARGTHLSEFLGIAPTRRAIVTHGVSVDRFADGRIVERWLELDMHGLLTQLGPARD
jgi:predicted ester cyclase